MNVTAPGPRSVAVGTMSGGTVLTGDVTVLVQGINALPTDFPARALPGGRKLLLILDALGEAAAWEPGPDLFPGRPPWGVRVVVSARLRAGEADSGPWLASLGWHQRGLGRSLDLKRLTQAG